MTKPEHTKEDLIRYLLGSLPEAEDERFDGLSVSDNEFALELTATEMDLVDAYVQGELSGETLARFETHYLASSARRDKVEFARALQTHGAEAFAPATVAAKPESRSPGFLAWLGSIAKQSTVRWSFAVSAAVLLVVGGWWISESGKTSAVASFVLAPPLRGNDQIATLSIPSRTRDVSIQLQLETDDYPSYRVALKEETEMTERWRSGALSATSKGESKVLGIRIPARLFKSKIYSLTVSGIGRDGTVELVSDYPFRAEVKQ
jgi:hypothetical protein